jgi:hypothetical protein
LCVWPEWCVWIPKNSVQTQLKYRISSSIHLSFWEREAPSTKCG